MPLAHVNLISATPYPPVLLPYASLGQKRGWRYRYSCPLRRLCPARKHLNVNHDAAGISFFGFGLFHVFRSSHLARCWPSSRLRPPFRIGGSVELLLYGVPPEVATITGGWTSSAFLKYWCKVEETILLSTPLAYSNSSLSRNSSSFQSFRIRHGIPSSSVSS